MVQYLHFRILKFPLMLPSGKRLQNELERSTILNRKINYFYGHFPVRYVTNYQRVNDVRMISYDFMLI